ncbi:MAG: hypothetical protein GX045_10710 [Clostridiaceae bacterium]|nr:hypothetical protein [Clostridiaceae bacterium]
MDIFIEKIVKRRKDIKDHLITAAVISGALLLMFIALNIEILAGVSMFIVVGIGYGAYYFITSRNTEYEYAVTNGDLDIDKIIAQRKRKRVFSANCKDFEIVARLKSQHYTPQYRNFKNKMDFTGYIGNDDVYFVVLHYNNQPTILFFEPSEKMLNNFKTFIPRKVFTD